MAYNLRLIPAHMQPSDTVIV